MTTNCRMCGAEMTTYPSRLKRNKGQFCSRSCYMNALRKRTGTASPRYGVRHTEEALVKIRAAAKANTKRGAENPRYKGCWASHGYKYVTLDSLPPDQREMAMAMGTRLMNKTGVMEHRLVMAMMVGRPLLPSECVHHRNGMRSDNRQENLELLPNGAHKARHSQIMAELKASRREIEILRAMVFSLCEMTYPPAGVTTSRAPA